MANLTLFETPKLPSHVASFFQEETNIQERVTVPSLSYEGKRWTISLNGEKTVMQTRNEDGDMVPAQIMRAVVLAYNPRRGRAYYTGEYDPTKIGAPTCWSEDGIAPHATVKEPCAQKCSECPMSVKGSKVTPQGRAVAACSQHKMVVVVPANKLDFQPLRLKLAITSVYDAMSPELEQQGWFAFDNYCDLLRARGVGHTAALVTKMNFDPNVPYPKVIFSPDRWLDEAELAQVAAAVKNPSVKQLLSGTWSPNGVDGTKIAAAAPEPKPEPKPVPKVAVEPEIKPAPKKAVPVEETPWEEPPVEAPKPAVRTAKAAAPKAAPVETPAPKAEAVTVSDELPDDLAALAEEWS